MKAFVGNNPPDIANPEESLATPLLFELEENDLKSEVDETNDVKAPVDDPGDRLFEGEHLPSVASDAALLS